MEAQQKKVIHRLSLQPKNEVHRMKTLGLDVGRIAVELEAIEDASPNLKRHFSFGFSSIL